MLTMHVQPVQIAVGSNVAEPDDNISLGGNKRIMRREQPVPCRNINVSVRPCIKLGRGVVHAVHRMNCPIEKLCKPNAVGRSIFPDKNNTAPFLYYI